MAKNRKLARARDISLPVPEGTLSGAPVVVGQIPGVALSDRGADGKSVIQRDGTFMLSVKGANKAGNKAIAVGDILFLKGTELGVNNEEGVRYGYALEAVNSGATTVIEVAIGY